PTVLIGSSRDGHTFTKDVVEAMASFRISHLKLADGVWAGWLYNTVFYIPLDIIKFFIRYAISGRAWDLVFDQLVGKMLTV
ncbi:hypothetical protein Tco_0208210, partial [Tanacetum coccineum]